MWGLQVVGVWFIVLLPSVLFVLVGPASSGFCLRRVSFFSSVKADVASLPFLFAIVVSAAGPAFLFVCICLNPSHTAISCGFAL